MVEATVAEPAGAITSESVLTGRDRELQRCADASARPGCVGVVLVGPAGVGKTTLAGAFAMQRCTTGAELVRISATKAAAGIPLGAVAPLLALPSAPTTQADLIRHTVASLTTRAESSGMVIIVDDAHLLDDASATLVHHLALAGSAFLVITVRSHEVVSDSITALWKDGLADRLDIDVLGLPESTALAASILGNPVHPTAATTLHAASGGNPLFLQQLVASARDDGAIALVAGRGPVPGRWTLVGPLPLPADLVSAVETRLEHIDEGERSILELLALGEPLEASVLEELAGDGGDVRLEHLEAQGFIIAEQDRRHFDVRLAHPMYGDVLRATMPRTWANRARRRLAEAVAAAGERGSGDDAMRIATWLLDAGAAIPGEIASRAARQALLRFDPERAERIVRSSDAYRPASRRTTGSVIGSVIGAPADGVAPAKTSDAESEMLLATIASFSGRADAALGHLDQLDRILDQIAHDGRLRSSGAVLRFDVLAYNLGRFEEAFALELPVDGDPSVGTALSARKAITAVAIALPRVAEAHLADVPVVEVGTAQDVWVCVATAMTHASCGRLHAALGAVDRAEFAFASLTWDPSLPDPAMVSYLRIRVLQHLGRLGESAMLADEAIEFELDRWSAQAVAWIRSAASSVLRMQGRAELAATTARDSAAVFEASGSSQLAVVALAEAAAGAATAGDAAGAELAARRCDELGVDNFHSRIAHAWAAIAAGRTSDGVRRLTTLLVGRRARDAREETLLALDIVRLGGAADVIEIARDQASRIDGDLVGVVARFAVAMAGDDGSALEQIADDFDSLGFSLPAAEAAVAACAAHLRHGDVRRSTSFAGRANVLRAHLDDVVSPALQPAEVQSRLPPREREVAALAAGGASSRAVAEALGLSPRTVESYVQSVYDKLGVASRAELAAALRPGLPGGARSARPDR